MWKSQKVCKEGQKEWLKKEAQERAATGDTNWEKGLGQILQVVESHVINRKLGAIVKGRFSPAMSRTEVPIHDWFHSAMSNGIDH